MLNIDAMVPLTLHGASTPGQGVELTNCFAAFRCSGTRACFSGHLDRFAIAS